MPFTGSDYWFKIHLKNLSDRSSRFFTELSNPSINLIHCYIIDHNNKLDTLPIMGDRLPFNTRSILANTFLYSLDIPYQESLTLIIRISNDYRQLHVPFKLWSNNFLWERPKVRVIYGVCHRIYYIVSILCPYSLPVW